MGKDKVRPPLMRRATSGRWDQRCRTGETLLRIRVAGAHDRTVEQLAGEVVGPDLRTQAFIEFMLGPDLPFVPSVGVPYVGEIFAAEVTGEFSSRLARMEGKFGKLAVFEAAIDSDSFASALRQGRGADYFGNIVAHYGNALVTHIRDVLVRNYEQILEGVVARAGACVREERYLIIDSKIVADIEVCRARKGRVIALAEAAGKEVCTELFEEIFRAAADTGVEDALSPNAARRVVILLREASIDLIRAAFLLPEKTVSPEEMALICFALQNGHGGEGTLGLYAEFERLGGGIAEIVRRAVAEYQS